ncbi:hypothetical protein C2E25_01035 [Geothermobacter hydrogeniphilus]|uniref:Uncharacterized protein n=1 Tax=Geothermobacter hydrogeniphilus TaxID=1969733 RepID=A0A2K2HDV1_9BACT|nr:hypothetical protein [Geothermobacter hydrogeniphilus]PNU21478.1 hypothetical protein C2E25_01035 [Geothermobacter hydrogeniphilus]
MDFIASHQWVIILAPFLIIATIGVILGTKNLKREKAVRKEAQAFGYITNDKNNVKKLDDIPDFFLLAPQGKHERFLQIRNIIKGYFDEIEFILFDYMSTYSKGRTNIITALAFLLSNDIHCYFSLTPIDKISRIHKYAINIASNYSSLNPEYRKIDVSDNSDFSDHYLLYSNNEQAVKRLFNENTIQLLSKQHSRGWHIVCKNGWMNLYHSHKTVAPGHVHDFLKKAKAIYETILAEQT